MYDYLPLPTTPRPLISTTPKYYTITFAAPSYYTDAPNVMLLLGVVSLMAGTITSVPMSPGYGGYLTAAKKYYTTSQPYYTKTSTYEAPKY
ncbi:LOW QUALITY PROTEIN: hypothetical protein DAPPUDRAFT_238127 [Daphnia pulex]|uniref:Uncharacterized protein n=1 Tax=Daphnia pulex TaxID=6669 RepID=E9G6Q0_DAPPU|nr:LOW QUALITY PROTEIN: hypothetical protein DAPPUDRAFT_238127 [Daphnia pulex]|eukprot:EFX84784.1 LOW QUALITY PROTEIN: hypothetical protein DAPPUDRAFT_238127 [Daphnia pulex]